MLYDSAYTIPLYNYFQLQKYYTLHLNTSVHYLGGLSQASNKIVQLVVNEAKKEEIIKYINNVYISQNNALFHSDPIICAFACLLPISSLNLTNDKELVKEVNQIDIDLINIIEEVKRALHRIDDELFKICKELSNRDRENKTARKVREYLKKLPNKLDGNEDEVSSTLEELDTFFIKQSNYIQSFKEMEDILNEEEFISNYDKQVNNWLHLFDLDIKKSKEITLSIFAAKYNSRLEQAKTEKSKWQTK